MTEITDRVWNAAMNDLAAQLNDIPEDILEAAMKVTSREGIARAIMAERKRAFVAKLDAILADPEAMERVCEYVITSVEDYAEAAIEALKQEVGRAQ